METALAASILVVALLVVYVFQLEQRISEMSLDLTQLQAAKAKADKLVADTKADLDKVDAEVVVLRANQKDPADQAAVDGLAANIATDLDQVEARLVASTPV